MLRTRLFAQSIAATFGHLGLTDYQRCVVLSQLQWDELHGDTRDFHRLGTSIPLWTQEILRLASLHVYDLPFYLLNWPRNASDATFTLQ